ncbi:DNA polymerase III subunit gamma/tau [Rickettsia endosymbiont of Cardiosporidium cionae]|uniref:DNA polymerase III subunit gamma/tau n=1 Tax=Rickettsia endosymbiont of Cardiosporidium cionae TaxID=2777155 RepID=UPI00189324DD|nr:DNA polymerase III subunit gamma/tau [Rickettsia endosymbiont of Cardiosporidium cionae]
MNSRYGSITQKYRPKNLSEIKGQEIVTKILNYSVLSSKIASAYLFTGARGVGKTSAARALAKAVNCTNISNVAGCATACGSCKNCIAVNDNAHPDILEFDAASKTSVDDIRDIISIAEYLPMLSKYKVFIIDEVHMLSKNAFNALLKIIEEPPNHVVFIFATTEIHKIALTFVSRCQRYNFKRCTNTALYQLISDIAKSEEMSIDKGAIELIVQNSEGIVRDALTMLEQSVVYSNINKINHVTIEIVTDVLSLGSFSDVIDVTANIICGNITSALNNINNVYMNTANIEIFLANIADFLAELVKYKLLDSYYNIIHENYLDKIQNILNTVSLEHLSILWQIFTQALMEIKSTHNMLVFLEMLIVKAIYSCAVKIEDNSDIADIDTKIDLKYYKSTDQAKSNIKSIDQDKSNIKSTDQAKSNIVIHQKGNSSNLNASIHPEYQDDIDNKIDCLHKNTTISNTEVHVESEALFDDRNDLDSLINFIRYCYELKAFDLYYIIMNQIEITMVEHNKVCIFGELSHDKLSMFKKILEGWSNGMWELHYLVKKDIISIKDKIVSDVKSSKCFKLLERNFIHVTVQDILLHT